MVCEQIKRTNILTGEDTYPEQLTISQYKYSNSVISEYFGGEQDGWFPWCSKESDKIQSQLFGRKIYSDDLESKNLVATCSRSQIKEDELIIMETLKLDFKSKDYYQFAKIYDWQENLLMKMKLIYKCSIEDDSLNVKNDTTVPAIDKSELKKIRKYFINECKSEESKKKCKCFFNHHVENISAADLFLNSMVSDGYMKEKGITPPTVTDEKAWKVMEMSMEASEKCEIYNE
jgi:hypothetical protein